MLRCHKLWPCDTCWSKLRWVPRISKFTGKFYANPVIEFPKFSIWSICFCSWLRHNVFMALTRELLYLTRVFISLLVLQHTSWAVNIHSPSLSAVQEMRIFFPSFDRWIGPTAMKRCWWVAWLEVPWQLLEGRSNRSWKLCYLHWLMVF